MNKKVYWIKIGGSDIIVYQLSIIIFGIIISLSMGILSAINSSQYSLYATLICIVLLVAVSFLYSKLYNISICNGRFQIKNIYRKIHYDINLYKEVSVALKFPFVLRMSFQDGKNYYFMLEIKKSFFSILFNSKREVESIKEIIQQEIRK